MSRLQRYADNVLAQPICGYHDNSPPATEPTAITAMALMALQEWDTAYLAVEWLTKVQAHRGSVGVTIDQGEPTWPTAVAMLAWQAFLQSSPFLGEVPWDMHLQQATDWLLDQGGKTQPRQPAFGHDPSIQGWPWVQGTHSWVEPTAWSVIALKRRGLADHARCRDGVRLLLDRQLPDGGCNYGNTFALGQKTLPHVLPTATSVVALQQETPDTRLEISLNYLQRVWPTTSGLASVSMAAVALTAFRRRPMDVEARIHRAWSRSASRRGTYYDALAILGNCKESHPMLLDRSTRSDQVENTVGEM